MDKQLIARVRKMEEDYNLLREVIDTLDGALYDYEAVQRRIHRLSDYQESGQWLKDFEADERGELPKDMLRGVLSEDALDDLLNDVTSIQARLDSLVDEPVDDEEMTPFEEFDPLFDSPDSIPEKAGVVIVTLRYMSTCPGFWLYEPKEFEGLDVPYVDKSENLRRRIVQKYLRGNSAQSSFRYSLGTLHCIPSITLDDGKHWRFDDKDERWLSGWIKENLVFYYKVSPFPDILALTYTKMYDPALNLDNDSKETEDFRKKLIASRNNHVEDADYDMVKTKASTIRLPKAVIISYDMPSDDRKKVYEKVSGVRKPFDSGEMHQCFMLSEKAILEDIEKMGITEEAQQNASSIFKAALYQLGYETVNISFNSAK